MVKKLSKIFGKDIVEIYFNISKPKAVASSYDDVVDSIQAMSLGINCFPTVISESGGFVRDKWHGGKRFPFNWQFSHDTSAIISMIKNNFTTFFTNMKGIVTLNDCR